MMALAHLIVLYVSLVSIVSWAKIIDLSHKHGPDTFMVFQATHYKRTVTFKGDFSPGVFFEMGDILSAEHGGTHMDAPKHGVEDGRSMDELRLENLIVPGVMIDCSVECNGSASYIMPLQKLYDWEKEHGRIPDGAGVVVNYGWSSRFENHNEYVQTANLSDGSSYRYPTMHTDVSKWLVYDRNAKIVAIDTMSPDMPPYPIHGVVLGADRVIIENVRDPGRLPARGFRLHAVPVAYLGADGGQVRFYAMEYDDEHSDNNGGITVTALVDTVLTLALASSLVLIGL